MQDNIARFVHKACRLEYIFKKYIIITTVINFIVEIVNMYKQV